MILLAGAEDVVGACEVVAVDEVPPQEVIRPTIRDKTTKTEIHRIQRFMILPLFLFSVPKFCFMQVLFEYRQLFIIHTSDVDNMQNLIKGGR
jgi:hypothetical protein